MKKSFLVLIMVVFLAAIIAPGLFGLVYQSVYDDFIYPEEIDCNKYRVNDGMVSPFTKTTVTTYDYWTKISLDKTASQTKIEIVPTVTPSNATVLDCTFVLVDENRHAGVQIDASTGVITLNHDTLINPGNHKVWDGADSFEITVTSNQDASLNQVLLFMLE